MKSYANVTLTASACLVLAGRATVFSKSDYPVRIESTPPGATIVVTSSDGAHVFEGKTPTTVTLPTKKGFFKGKNYTIQASSPGYDPLTVPINRSVDGWYIANVLFGGVLGLLIVDPATGAMWKLDEAVALNLVRSSGPQTGRTDRPAALTVWSLDQLPAVYRPRLERIR